MRCRSSFRNFAWVVVVSLMQVGCSAADFSRQNDESSSGGGDSNPPPSSGGATPTNAAGGSISTGGSASEPQAEDSAGAPGQDLDGSGGTPHPLFGSGSDDGADLSDPCVTAVVWKEETAIELERGSVVLFEGTLWELTGTCNENWALPDCTPPGTGWCKDQYGWIVVGSCS